MPAVALAPMKAWHGIAFVVVTAIALYYFEMADPNHRLHCRLGKALELVELEISDHDVCRAPSGAQFHRRAV